jgi:hypothetical protein
LDAHKLARSQTYKKRLELLAKAIEFRSSDALTQAKSRLAVTRAKQLRVLQTQLEDYRRQIEELFAQHPEHDLFGSLPGADPKIAPRLLVELGEDRNRSNPLSPAMLRRDRSGQLSVRPRPQGQTSWPVRNSPPIDSLPVG